MTPEELERRRKRVQEAATQSLTRKDKLTASSYPAGVLVGKVNGQDKRLSFEHSGMRFDFYRERDARSYSLFKQVKEIANTLPVILRNRILADALHATWR